MTGPLQDQTVLVIGRGGGIARAVTLAACDAGAQVVAAGRDQRTLAAVYAGEPEITTETVDLTDEASIADLGRRLDGVGHVVSTASARAHGRVADLDRDAIRRSLDTKVIGPLMLAKRLAPRMAAGGSFVLFSGVPRPRSRSGPWGWLTNGAADVLARSLALELAPIRVNAISPGWSTPAPGTPSASRARPTTSPTSAPTTRHDASAPSTTSPTASCSP
jgi:NAD(P)-dependent dehydrogenase (short-subunit alcohol dehydrogenase family)